MNNISDAEYFVINSTSCNFSTNLNIDLTRNYTHVALTSCGIPKTFYVLPNTCTLTVTEGTETSNITFLAGNYSAKQTFLTQFNANMTGCNYTYNITYPTMPDTGLYSINVSNNSGVQPSIMTSDNFLAGCLGILPNMSYTFSGNTFTSVKVINFQAYSQLLIKSNIVSNKSKLLQEIYVSDNLYNNAVVWNNNNTEINAKSLKPVSSNVYDFTLQDVDGNIVNLNGAEWSFVIVLFKVDDLSTVIKRYIEVELLKEKMNNIDLE